MRLQKKQLCNDQIIQTKTNTMITKTITLRKVLLSLSICLMLISAGSLTTACKQEPKPEDSKEVAEDENEVKFDANEAKEDDSEFLVSAAETNLMEIELGKLAQSKSTNAEVKKFANMMIKDHTKAWDELKAFATTNNISLPEAITEKGKEHYEDLNKKSGKDFDKAYADMMANKHDDAISKMEKAAEDANSADVRTWAANMLPTLNGHLQQAKMLQEKVK